MKLADLKRAADEREKRSKKASKKRTRRPSARKSVAIAVPEEGLNRELKAMAAEAEVRSFVRHWAACGWDALQAVARMHPSLKPSELEPIATDYRRSQHFQPVLRDILGEIIDRVTLSQPEAEEILSRQATTSLLDFLNEDGTVRSVSELRQMPRHAQLTLKKIKVTRAVKFDKEGNKEEESQTVELEAYDIQNAIKILADIKEWGVSSDERDLAKLIKAAESRLQRNVIDMDAIDPQED